MLRWQRSWTGLARVLVRRVSTVDADGKIEPPIVSSSTAAGKDAQSALPPVLSLPISHYLDTHKAVQQLQAAGEWLCE